MVYSPTPQLASMTEPRTSSSLVFDHLAVTSRTLDDGVEHVRDHTGIDMPLGGRHPLMATHNRLMALGDAEFLEVIAIDPAAPAPARPRWFALDRFAGDPRIGTWVLGTDDIETALETLSARLPDVDPGRPVRLTRGDLRWLISVRDDGSMPFDGTFPALIQWPKGTHPAARMSGDGCSLARLIIEHPEGEQIATALDGLLRDTRIVVREGVRPHLAAELITPRGVRALR